MSDFQEPDDPRGPLNLEDRATVEGIVGIPFISFVKKYYPPPKDERSYFDLCYAPSMWLRVAKRVPADHLFLYSTRLAKSDNMLARLIEGRDNLDKRILHEGNEELSVWADRRPEYELSMACTVKLRKHPCWHVVVREWLSGLSAGSGVQMRRLYLVYSSKVLLTHFRQDSGGWKQHLEVEVKGWYEWLGREVGRVESKLK